MPDLLGYVVTKGAVVNGIQTFSVECKVVDSRDQKQVQKDFSGVKALQFPSVLATLTPAESDEFCRMVADWMVRRAIG
jgi:hypothetical protein